MASAVEKKWRQLIGQREGSGSAGHAAPADPIVRVGSMPTGVVVNPVGGASAYVLNEGDTPGTVSVISTATNAVLTTIRVGSFPFGAAATPNGASVYVTNTADGTVSVINTAVNAVTATITVGSGPLGVAVSPDGRQAYVANSDGPGTVSVINTATNAVTAGITLGGGPMGVAAAVTPDGSNVYVTNNVDDTVNVISTVSNAPITTIPVGTGPTGVAFTPDGLSAYVANGMDNTVSVINTANNTVTATIPVGMSPVAVAASPDGRHIFVVNNGDDTVSVISTVTNTVTFVIPVGRQPVDAAVTPDGTTLYVTNNGDNTVTITPAAPFPTTTTLTTAPDPTVFGQPKVFTTTVSSPQGVPTGTVTFLDGQSPVGSATLGPAGQAGFTTAALLPGSHSLTAVYQGDNNFRQSSSPVDVQTVNKAVSTTVLTAVPDPATVGRPVRLTARVIVLPPGSGTPTGTVTFLDGHTALGTTPLDGSGTAALPLQDPTAGSHALSAVYSGDAEFLGSAGQFNLFVNGLPTRITAVPAVIRFDLSHFQFYIPTLTATLTDQTGTGIPGRLITFSAMPLTGPLTLGTAVTDAHGTAVLSNAVVPPTLITTNQYLAVFAGDATLSPANTTAALAFEIFARQPG
ncbi:Ig-like domain repeat protein [Streptomyces orinoci]|uniref:Ig-like domain repeat protein n=1 Tax=Streptomyces orinoci TaxID=67339 RepID=A0ABV3K3Q3_STRON|nr:Ig-like domain repeat protein [Streptomyces orinoci]